MLSTSYKAFVDAPLPLSIAIITLNEEANLPRCLASVRGLAAEIVVIDSGSTDRTAALARESGAVFEFQKWQGHVAQKNIALQRCSQPWVLCVDADEVVSLELAASIRHVFAEGELSPDGFYLNRRTFYLGDWIRHVWYPEWRLRLVRRKRAGWRGIDPHDRLEVAGPTGRLAGDLLHYSYRDLQDHLHRTIKYAQISATAYAQAGKSYHWYYLLFSPWIAFFRQLIIRQGWRDGWRGWLIAGVTMIHVFAKYAFLLEKRAAEVKANKET
jgi:glycosyltransferase involved in cell wall biosynthesis